MKSIAFYNNKGGVAKTTSVINLGYELAHESKVLIIDTDGQANCSRFFTDKPKAGLDKALTSVEVTPEKALCKTKYNNIDIITATAALNRAAVRFEKLSDEEQAEIARNIISFGSEYDYVLLDMPPALSQMTEKLVSACDVVFIPIELGTFSIQGIPTVTSIVSRCGAKFGGCFVTKFDRKNSADEQLLKQLQEILGNKALNSKIPFSRVIKNSISGGLTASEYMGWTAPAKSYAALAEEIKERV